MISIAYSVEVPFIALSGNSEVFFYKGRPPGPNHLFTCTALQKAFEQFKKKTDDLVRENVPKHSQQTTLAYASC